LYDNLKILGFVRLDTTASHPEIAQLPRRHPIRE